MCPPLRTSSLAPAEASSLQPERERNERPGPGQVRQGKRKRVVAGLASSDTNTIPALAVAGSQPPFDRTGSSSATATATHARTRPPSIPSCSTVLPACLPYLLVPTTRMVDGRAGGRAYDGPPFARGGRVVARGGAGPAARSWCGCGRGSFAMRWGVESRNAQPLGPAGDYATGGAGAASLPEEKRLGACGCVWHVRLCLCLAVRA
jgi:hypothetical protein